MAESFDLKLANSLIPDFDGKSINIEDFLDKCEFYNSQLKVSDQEKFLNFLLKVKILRDVKAKFSIEATPTTFEQFKQIIINRFSSKVTKEQKLDELENLRQNGNIADFATNLESICAELIKLKMKNKQQNEKETIRNEVEENAIRIFTRGIRKTEIRQALIFKEPKSLESAIQFALEAEAKLGSGNEVTINRYNQRSYNNNVQYNRPNRNFSQRQYQNRGIQNFNNKDSYRHNNQSFRNWNHSLRNNTQYGSARNLDPISKTPSKYFNSKYYHQTKGNGYNKSENEASNLNRSNIHVLNIESEESENESRPQQQQQEQKFN